MKKSRRPYSLSNWPYNLIELENNKHEYERVIKKYYVGNYYMRRVLSPLLEITTIRTLEFDKKLDELEELLFEILRIKYEFDYPEEGKHGFDDFVKKCKDECDEEFNWWLHNGCPPCKTIWGE